MSDDLLQEVKEVLEVGGLEFIDLEAKRIVADAAGISPAELPLLDGLDAAVRQRALDMAHRRAAGEPLQYVTGLAGFRRLDIMVGPGVFIPRPETELVAERAMDLLPRDGTLVDVCSGSGAIALAVKDERPDATVLATENSSEALEWARKNVEKTGLDVELLRGDLFAPVPESLHGVVDVIVANPPYIPRADAHLLPVEVAAHEPEASLFADASGLSVVGRIVDEARQWLRLGGWLVLEIGDRQDAAVKALLGDAGYDDVSLENDLADRPRIAIGRHV